MNQPTRNQKILVATVLTVYGIETIIKQFIIKFHFKLQQYLPFTVLKLAEFNTECAEILLQQYLPFTVLKRYSITAHTNIRLTLQQYLPFTVLKLDIY